MWSDIFLELLSEISFYGQNFSLAFKIIQKILNFISQ